MIRLTLSYTIAFAIALLVAWGVLSLNAQGLFLEPTSPRFLISMLFPPLAGAAAFILVFGLSMQIKPGALFWASTLCLVFGFYFAAITMIFLGYLTFVESLVLNPAALALVGWAIARRNLTEATT